MHTPTQHENIDLLQAAPRAHLGRWPTPVQYLERGVWVKRDDLSGLGRGGAKARKIEHVVGHLQARGADELIAVAGNVTNLAFDLIPVLDQAGIRPTLFIADDPPTAPERRDEIFDGVLHRIQLIDSRRSTALRRMATAWIAGRRAGRRPFVLLPGGSHPVALIGNACGFIEMATQFEALGKPLPDTVFITVATGTTIGGFLLGEHALRKAGHRPIRIIGVQVYPGHADLWVRMLIRWSERFAGLRDAVPQDRIEIVTSALMGGFANFSDSLADECNHVRELEGIGVDPIFGGKTWRVMEQFRTAARKPAGSVLFWHCGYTPEWQALRAGGSPESRTGSPEHPA
jgi:D-cysteine desulfhydrase